MLKRLKNNYLLFLSFFFIAYFFFNLLSGERGLISFIEKKKILKKLEIKQSQTTNELKELELKNLLLSDNLDLDYIETLIRERFLFGKKNETIYMIKNNDIKN